MPIETAHGDVVMVLALMMLLTPALGVPHEEMLQDTLKSMLVSFSALGAGLLLFWHQRQRQESLRWHALLGLPLVLMLWALGSMAWSHTYLAGVEAIRWFIFSLLAWLGLNAVSRERTNVLAWGIHGGAFVASVWTAAQFWGDFNFFPQGPNPASTFVNRNFYAEFAVCTLPFSGWLITQIRSAPVLALLALTTGFNLVAILMTGTRSALLALLLLVVLLPFVLWRFRAQLSLTKWPRSSRLMVPLVLAGTVLALGGLPTGNSKLIEEHRVEQRGMTPVARALARSKSMAKSEEYTQGSFSLRMQMWKATGRMMAARPLTGVGAGAWEVDIPLYQPEGAQLETDYYAHNEFLQLLAEYGLVGWLFLAGLLAYLALAIRRTWSADPADARSEGLLRALLIVTLLMFLLVSQAGFPWRMASTGALFALTLGLLAASDARLGWHGWAGAQRLRWRAVYSRLSLVALAVCLIVALYIARQAATVESKIVRAVKIALTISNSGDVHSPRWAERRQEMLGLLREAIAINPHYRKITPMAADELAKWGDWQNATWVWESVLHSRPYVVAIMANVARGYAQMGRTDEAIAVLLRARAVQPKAPSINSLGVILLARNGQEAEARRIARSLIDEGVYDFDLLNATYVLAGRARDWPLAIRALELRIHRWPAYAVDGWLKIGEIYAREAEAKDETKALAAYRQAWAAAPEAQKPATWAKIPEIYRSRL